jgi:pentatricopeptide repeat protein
MAAYVQAKDTKAAERVLQQMKDAGVTPDEVTFSTLMAAYATNGDEKGAMKVFRSLMASSVSVRSSHIGLLAVAHAVNENWAEFWSALMHGYIRHNQVLADSHIFHPWMHQFSLQSQSARIVALVELLQRVSQRGLHEATWKKAVEKVSHASSSASSEALAGILKLFEESGVRVDPGWLRDLGRVASTRALRDWAKLALAAASGKAEAKDGLFKNAPSAPVSKVASQDAKVNHRRQARELRKLWFESALRRPASGLGKGGFKAVYAARDRSGVFAVMVPHENKNGASGACLHRFTLA